VRRVPDAALVSFRLGGRDGVSVESAKWAAALGTLGWRVETVAGAGPVDHLLPGLAMGATEAPSRDQLRHVLAPFDLVVVENLCSLPLNPAAAVAVAAVRAGRPTILHHHDLAWQRPQLAHLPPPPDDPAWAHVTINELSRRQLAQRGIAATTMYNRFDPDPPAAGRERVRRALGVADGTRLLLQPTRALERKDVGAGLSVAAAVGGTYWLLGPAEDGYGPELERLVARADGPVLLGTGGLAGSIDEAYAASDVVLLPSTWEGFGNPSLESATHRRPLAIGPYPVAAELAGFGFRWFDSADPAALGAWLDEPDPDLVEVNHAIAARHFNLADLPDELATVLGTLATVR
jgi:glycosyltransferase involved in cell wall biosynthesis